MKINQILFILLVLFFPLTLCIGSLTFSEEKKELKFYVKGKGFDSIHNYKLAILKQKIIEAIPTDKKYYFGEFLSSLSDAFSYENTKEYSENDLKSVFQDISESLIDKAIERPEADDFKGMQEMIDDYKKSGAYVIEPDKVKTIMIDKSSKEDSRKKR